MGQRSDNVQLTQSDTHRKAHIASHIRPPLVRAALVFLCPLIAWATYVMTAPIYPNSIEVSESGCQHTGANFISQHEKSLSIASQRCFRVGDSPERVDQWYQKLGWEDGGRIGGSWDDGAIEFWFFKSSWYRRAYAETICIRCQDWNPECLPEHPPVTVTSIFVTFRFWISYSPG